MKRMRSLLESEWLSDLIRPGRCRGSAPGPSERDPRVLRILPSSDPRGPIPWRATHSSPTTTSGAGRATCRTTRRPTRARWRARPPRQLRRLVRDTVAELEGYARPLWGIVPLVGRRRRRSSTGIVGSRPRRRHRSGATEYWGPCAEAIDQRMVEMAAIGFALAFTPSTSGIRSPGRSATT